MDGGEPRTSSRCRAALELRSRQTAAAHPKHRFLFCALRYLATRFPCRQRRDGRQTIDRPTRSILESIIRTILQWVTARAVPCAGSLGRYLSARQIDLRLIPLARDLLRNEGAAQALACRMSGWRPWRHDGYRNSPAAGVQGGGRSGRVFGRPGHPERGRSTGMRRSASNGPNAPTSLDNRTRQ